MSQDWHASIRATRATVPSQAYLSLIPGDVLDMIHRWPLLQSNLVLAALVAWIKIPHSRSTFMACFPGNDACEVLWTESSSVAAERLWDALVHFVADG